MSGDDYLQRVVPSASGIELSGELIPWSEVVWVGAEIEDGRLVFGVARASPPAGITTTTWGVGDDEASDAAALRILAAVREHCPRAVRPGWLARPSVAWEPVAAIPVHPPPNTTGYRAPGAASILAHRIATPVESLLTWLCRLRDGTREIVVTPEHVYARRSAGTWRVPLAALAARYDDGYWGNPFERALSVPRTRLYVFGRRALLEVLHREGCPVQAVLDRILATKV